MSLNDYQPVALTSIAMKVLSTYIHMYAKQTSHLKQTHSTPNIYYILGYGVWSVNCQWPTEMLQASKYITIYYKHIHVEITSNYVQIINDYVEIMSLNRLSTCCSYIHCHEGVEHLVLLNLQTAIDSARPTSVHLQSKQVSGRHSMSWSTSCFQTPQLPHHLCTNTLHRLQTIQHSTQSCYINSSTNSGCWMLTLKCAGW